MVSKICLERSSYLKIRANLERLILKNKEINPHFQIFSSELYNADIVEDGKLPVNIITINSTVKFRYGDKTQSSEACLVLPADVADDSKNLSIFSPLPYMSR